MPERGFPRAFVCGVGGGGRAPGGLGGPGLRWPDNSRLMPDFFFLRRLRFSGGASGYLPVCRAGFLTSGFSVILSPFRVCARCRFARPVFACPVTVTASCRPCRGVPVLRLLPRRVCLPPVRCPLRFRVAGEPVPAACACPALSGLALCGLFLCGSLFTPLASALRFVLYRFFPAGFFRLFCAGASSPESGRVSARSV